MSNKPLNFPILTTERLTLRQLSENDVEEIFSLRSDATINKFLHRKPCESLEEALNFIRIIRENEILYWAITETNNEKLIGTICLFDISEELNKCEIGYELLTNYQGQGFMKEAIQEIINFTINQLHFKTIDACTHKDNESSIKLLQKFNFVKVENTDEIIPNQIQFRISN